jgi:hypothetical protein
MKAQRRQEWSISRVADVASCRARSCAHSRVRLQTLADASRHFSIAAVPSRALSETRRSDGGLRQITGGHVLTSAPGANLSSTWFVSVQSLQADQESTELGAAGRQHDSSTSG